MGILKVPVGSKIVHTITLREDGTVWMWGGNNSGSLGIGVESEFDDIHSTPVQVHGGDTGDEFLNLFG